MDLNTARRKMIESQIRPNDVTDVNVIDAFSKVPREAFLPKASSAIAYSETELETVPGRRFWLARDLSKLLEALAVKKKELALVIGAGEGYSAALLDHIADTVIALDEDEAVTDNASELLSSLGMDRVAFVTGKLADGYPDEGPFDVILVNGMVEHVPSAWLEQLAPGGRLGVVVGNSGNGQVRVYTATQTSVSYRSVFECVPPKLAELDVEESFIF